MFNIDEIIEFAKNKGFDINQTESLGVSSFLELRPSSKLIEKEINSLKNDPDMFFKEYFNTTLTSDQLRCLNKSRFFDKFLISGRRKSGMSTLSLFWAIRSAVLYNKMVVLVCSTHQIANSMFTKLLVYMNQCPGWLSTIKEQSSSNNRLKLNGGGSVEIISLKKASLIGKTPNCVIIEDVTQFESLELKSFYTSIYPVISYSNSELVIMSSDDAQESTFFDDLVFNSQMGLAPFVIDHLKRIEYSHLKQI